MKLKYTGEPKWFAQFGDLKTGDVIEVAEVDTSRYLDNGGFELYTPAPAAPQKPKDGDK